MNSPSKRINGTPEERFWPRVNKNGPVPEHRPELGPCWLWTTTASTDNGYSQFRHGPRMELAHRFAYKTVIGPIPDELQLDHLCHNQSSCTGGPTCPHRKCVNPDHLDPMTNDENQARRVGMHVNKKPKCKQGHKFDDVNTGWTSTGRRLCIQCRKDAFTRWAIKTGRKKG